MKRSKKTSSASCNGTPRCPSPRPSACNRYPWAWCWRDSHTVGSTVTSSDWLVAATVRGRGLGDDADLSIRLIRVGCLAHALVGLQCGTQGAAEHGDRGGQPREPDLVRHARGAAQRDAQQVRWHKQQRRREHGGEQGGVE